LLTYSVNIRRASNFKLNLQIMRKFKPLALALTIIFSGALLHSCQEDNLAEPADALLLKTSTVAPDCNDCFTPDGPFVEKHFQEVVTWGRNFSKTVDVVVYNTEDEFVVKLKSTHPMANIKVVFPDGSSSSLKNVRGQYPANRWIEKTFDLPQDWKICDNFDLELIVAGQGPPVVVDVQYGLTVACSDALTVEDHEGNVYPVVKIGEQYWMAKNLAVTTYQNGDLIPTSITDSWLELGESETGGVAVLDYFHESFPELDTKEKVIELFGRLYNWYAVDDDRGLCPSGWRVPAASDWHQMRDYLITSYDHVTSENISIKLRSENWWYYYDDGQTYNGTNEFGFNALPAGYIEYLGPSWGGGYTAVFWATDEIDQDYAVSVRINHYSEDLNISYGPKSVGSSIRCIKD
jgi:uncharacterized protein (TIGR02145 family)